MYFNGKTLDKHWGCSIAIDSIVYSVLRLRKISSCNLWLALYFTQSDNLTVHQQKLQQGLLCCWLHHYQYNSRLSYSDILHHIIPHNMHFSRGYVDLIKVQSFSIYFVSELSATVHGNMCLMASWTWWSQRVLSHCPRKPQYDNLHNGLTQKDAAEYVLMLIRYSKENKI